MEFFGLWEGLYNPDFTPFEFERGRFIQLYNSVSFCQQRFSAYDLTMPSTYIVNEEIINV